MAQDLGEAKGTIIIDVAQAESAGIKVKRVGKKMEMDLGRVSIAAKKASVSLGGLGKTLGAVGGLDGLAVVAGDLQPPSRYLRNVISVGRGASLRSRGCGR